MCTCEFCGTPSSPHTRTHHDDTTTHMHVCVDTHMRHPFANTVETQVATHTRVPCDTGVTQFTLRATYDTCDVIIRVMCHGVDHMSSIRVMCIPSHISQGIMSCTNQAVHPKSHVASSACQRTCAHVTCMCITRHIICHVSSSCASSCIHWVSQVIVRVRCCHACHTIVVLVSCNHYVCVWE